MARKGLGKGLDSLIPDFYNEDFDSNSPQSLEDMLNEQEREEENSAEDNASENIFEQIKREQLEEENSSNDNEEVLEDVQEDNENDTPSEEASGEVPSEESIQTLHEVKIQEDHVAEVKEIVDKNPRITLWSSRSSAVFRYLRKTEPEFSISKEASILID